MSWTYAGKIFKDEDIPVGAVGFIYQMTAIIDGKSWAYIGKKNFQSVRKKKLGKRSLPIDRRKKRYETIVKMDYQNYYSSNTVLKKAHEEGIKIRREILRICYTKGELTYQEVKYQFAYEVLEHECFLNANILGRFFKQQKNE